MLYAVRMSDAFNVARRYVLKNLMARSSACMSPRREAASGGGRHQGELRQARERDGRHHDREPGRPPVGDGERAEAHGEGEGSDR